MQSLGYYWMRATFVLVGVLLVAASLGLTHATSTRTLRAQLTDSNAAILREVATHISNRVTRLDQRLLELAGRRVALDFMHSRFSDVAEQRDSSRLVQIELTLIRRSDPLVHSAGVHSRRSGYLLSDRIGLSYIGTGDPRHIDVPLARSELETILHAGSDFRILSTLTEQGPVRVVPLRRLYPLGAGPENALGSIFIGLDTRHLADTVLQASRERVHEILVMDSSRDDASILAASSSWAERELLAYTVQSESWNPSPDSFEVRLGGRRYGVARVLIPETGWVMIGAVSLSGGTPLLVTMQITFLLIGTGMLLAALLSLLTLSRFTIDPLLGFVRKVSSWVPDALSASEAPIRLPASGAHLSRLELRFRETIDQSQKMKDRFASATPIIHRYCLRNLFAGTGHSEELVSQLAEHGLALHTGAFAILRLALTERPSGVNAPSQLSSVTPRNPLVSISESRLAELSSGYLGEHGQCAVLLEKNNRVSVLISSADRARLEGPVLMTLAEQIRIGLASTLGVSVSAGLGSIVTKAHEISSSWRTATKALDYTLMFQTRALYRHDDIELVESSVPMRELLAEVNALQDSVRSGDADDAGQRVARLFRDAQSARLPGDSVRQIGVHVLMEGLRVAQESGCLIPEQHVNEATAVWHDFDHAETMTEIENLTTQVIRQLTIDVGKQRQEHHRHELVDSIIEYIEDHYASPDLSLSSVAVRFGISPAYLSKLFKEHAGVKYIDFLATLRVTVAKALLERGLHNVNEVAEHIGYTNTRSFIRMFRAETGHTPGEYRRLYIIRRENSDSGLPSDNPD